MSYRPRKVLPEDQVGEVGGNIIRALPNAMRMLEKQGIVTAQQATGYANDLSRLSCALTAMFKDIYNDHANIAVLLEKYYIDCDAAPHVPRGCELAEHKRSSRLFWDGERQARALLLPQDRNYRYDAFIPGKVKEQIRNLPVLNTNVLDSLLAKRHPTPESWDGNETYFVGTLYLDMRDHLVVRGLRKEGNDLAEVKAQLVDVWNKHLIALRA